MSHREAFYHDSDDDFEAAVELRKLQRYDNTKSSINRTDGWNLLSQGKTLGHKVGLSFATPPVALQQPQLNLVDMLNLPGVEGQEIQLNVQLSPPTMGIVPAAGIDISGTQDNLQTYTSTPFVPIGTAKPWANSLARIFWGIGSVVEYVDIDITNGAMVNLNASFIRILAGFDVFPGGEYGDPNFIRGYQFGAFVGPGFRAGSPPTRTIMGANPANNAESRAFPIPRYAKRVIVMNPSAPANIFAGKIRYWRDDAGAGSAFPVGSSFFSENQPVSSIIPSGAMYFTIFNSSGFDAGNLRVIFELGL